MRRRVFLMETLIQSLLLIRPPCIPIFPTEGFSILMLILFLLQHLTEGFTKNSQYLLCIFMLELFSELLGLKYIPYACTLLTAFLFFSPVKVHYLP